jgi:hypothetical protein
VTTEDGTMSFGSLGVQGDGIADLVVAIHRAELEVGRMESPPDQRRLKLLLSVVWRSIASPVPLSPRQLAFLRHVVDGVASDAIAF